MCMSLLAVDNLSAEENETIRVNLGRRIEFFRNRIFEPDGARLVLEADLGRFGDRKYWTRRFRDLRRNQIKILDSTSRRRFRLRPFRGFCRRWRRRGFLLGQLVSDFVLHLRSRKISLDFSSLQDFIFKDKVVATNVRNVAKSRWRNKSFLGSQNYSNKALGTSRSFK